MFVLRSVDFQMLYVSVNQQKNQTGIYMLRVREGESMYCYIWLFMPPFMTFENCFPSRPYSRNGPNNASYGISLNGYMNSKLFTK